MAQEKDCASLCPQNICLSTCHVSPALVCFLSYLSNDFTDTHNTLEHDEHLGPDAATISDRVAVSLRQSLLQDASPKIIGTNVIDSEAISPEDFEPRRIEFNRNLGTVPPQVHEGFLRSSLTGDMEEFRKVGADVSYFQSQMHSEYDSAESIADSDLEDGELRKMLASPLYLQNREDHESSRIPIATAKLCALLQKRGASAKRAQADLRKGLLSSSSQGPSCTGETCCMVFIGKQRTAKPTQEFCFQKRVPVKSGKISPLKAIKIICSVRQDLNF